ncbi:hypothetical protein Q5H93_19790 [Hymenobacter sp. ASUV-10]|uniref:Uncharacterized protein n=1 Tax=Hymenobacter aranciens TaxID=3063996 RepID=A0ABT9BH51_9BACT|nr:hypothetical protein [Hymenobacter sp. ASUV-10]MDO7876998.1 hypothetical protein [Hymenobacter sp. ASUV-10]
MAFPRPIGPHNHIQPRAKGKFGIFKDGKIAEVQALEHGAKLRRGG